MSIDTDLERYLHARAREIHLPPGDLRAVSQRARHLRRRRTAARGGIAAALLAGGSLLVVDRARSTDVTEQAGEGSQVAPPSPLDWALVEARAGLGGFSSTVTEGGDVYSLSTSPGPEEAAPSAEPRRLYRSPDGTDWEQVGLPDGLYASALAVADGSLYAAGTSAAGGEVTGVSLASSTDGGDEWSAVDLPLDLAALAEGFPGDVIVTDISVAPRAGTTVAVVTVGGIVDTEALLGAGADEEWSQGPEGLTRWEPCDAASSETSPLPSTTTAPAEGPDDADAAAGRPDGASATCEGEVRSWSDLGLTPAQEQLIAGEAHLFTTDADGVLVAGETLPVGPAAAGATNSGLLAADDGWWLATAAPDGAEGMTLWSSVDGVTWEPTTTLAEGIVTTGVVAGRPVLVTSASDGSSSIRVHRVEADGSLTTTEVAAAVGATPGFLYGFGIGPMGVALVVPTDEEGTTASLVVATAPDGVSFSAEPLPPAPDDGSRQNVNGVTVTADAVKVRLNVRSADDRTGGVPDRQVLFVGTRG